LNSSASSAATDPVIGPMLEARAFLNSGKGSKNCLLLRACSADRIVNRPYSKINLL